MSRFVLDRPPANPDELYHLVQVLWGVTIPRHKVCDNHVSPFQAFSDAYFAECTLPGKEGPATISLWHGSRGLSGKSFALSALGLTKAFMEGADTNILGGSLAQSTNVHEHMRSELDNDHAPRYMIETESQTLIKLSNKARIRPLTASQKTVRGPHPPFLLLDEIDEMDQEILDAALGQPMPQKNYLGQIVQPYTVMCSTWQNPEGTFTEIMRRVEERDLPYYAWCYRESANEVDGWLTQATIEAKKQEIPAEMWRVEYELGEPSIGNRAFDTPSVERTFTLPFTPLEQKVAKDYEEYCFEKPAADGFYVAAADWAKERDYTVISVFRIKAGPMRLVYYARLNRRPYPFMIDMFNKVINDYNAQATHDATGLGNVVNDMLDMRAAKFVMIGKDRANMLTEYVGAVEKDQVRVPMIKTAYYAHKYCQVGDLYSNTQEYHLPDEVCSFALAWRMAKRFAPDTPMVGVPKDNSPNKYQKIFDPAPEPDQLAPVNDMGEVYIKDEQTGVITLLV